MLASNQTPLPLQPPQRPLSRSRQNSNSHSHNNSMLLSSHTNPRQPNLLMPADKSMKSSLGRAGSATSSKVNSGIGSSPTSKRLLPGGSSQSGGGKEREDRGTMEGKSLLGQMGVKQLTLLKCLRMLIKRRITSPQTCDTSGMMMMTQTKLS